jgi:hypothetical protein
MRLTPGEARALRWMIPAGLFFLPPVTNWAAGARPRVLGIPFLVFWSACGILATSLAALAALRAKDRIDGPDDR